MAPSARLEHATYCSASKRSNPLSYEGIWQAGILIQKWRLVKVNGFTRANPPESNHFFEPVLKIQEPPPGRKIYRFVP